MTQTNDSPTVIDWPLPSESALVLSHSTLEYLRNPENVMYGMSDDRRAAFLAEEGWTLQESLPLLQKGEPEAIGLGLKVCPTCNGQKTVALPVKGNTNGVMAKWEVDCYCEDFAPFFRRWNAMVPLAYRKFQLAFLSTSSASRVPTGVQNS